MDTRWIALAALVGSAVLLVLGSFSGQWLSGDDGYLTVDIGLTAIEVCQDGACETSSFSEYDSNQLGVVRPLGLICFGFGMAAALALLLCGGLSVLRKAKNWFMSPSTIAIIISGLALIVGVVTLVTLKKNVGAFHSGTGLGFVFYGLGSAGGFISAIFAGRGSVDDEDQFEPGFDPI